MRTRFLLGEVADSVLRANPEYRINPEYFKGELTDLIPDDLLNTEFNSQNFRGLAEELDELRFAKQEELSAIISNRIRLGEILFQYSDGKLPANRLVSNLWKQLARKPNKLKYLLNRDRNSLPEPLEQKCKEIRFLLNVGTTLLHW